MQSVTFKKGVDNKRDYNKFKLVSGRNFALVHKLGFELAEGMAKLINISDFDEYVKETSEYVEEKKDPAPLLIKYADVIKKYRETNELVDKMLEEEIEIEVEMFPLEKIPINITGSFLHSIESVLLV